MVTLTCNASKAKREREKEGKRTQHRLKGPLLCGAHEKKGVGML